ncbi:hypothetical protein HD554DRAFT_2070125 [Boletus coccyginus]|nr:hypothetical protein HD554DRAFT_2070125 [Boletus coccyginus]
MRSVVYLLSFLLGGQALALTIDVGGTLGNVSASDFLNVADTYLLTDCRAQCDKATSVMNDCGTNDQCLCNTNTVTAITSCQQCMFNDLVAKFTTSADPRAGSAAALAAYAMACFGVDADVPTSLVTLTTPPVWDGPFEVELSTGEAVLTVAVAIFLGGGALLLLSNV